MKQSFIPPILMAITSSSPSKSNTYEIDTNASICTWNGYKVTGQHTGTVKVKKGTIIMTDGFFTGGKIEIDMNSIKCIDLDNEYASKLEGHLKSADFFGAEKYPIVKFELTRSIAQDSKGNYKIIGNVTIKETTREVKCFASAIQNNAIISVNGKLTLDRSEFNVKYGSGSFFDGLGDKTIYDEFDIGFNLKSK